MVQFKKISLIILLLAIAVCLAEPPRYRQRLTAKKMQPLKQRPAGQQKRVLARQEAVTPYPTADELKPEVPFEEGNKPDEVYGPPKDNQTPADQLPSEEPPEEFAPNSDAEEFQPAEVENTSEQISRLTSGKKTNRKNILSRFVQKKNTRKSQRLPVAPAKVFAAPVSVLPSTSPISSSYTAKSSQKYYFSNQPFVYTAHYQAW